MSDLARKLIAENKRTKAKFLDLGNCGLTKVPAEVGELIWLESLSFASEWDEWDRQRVQRKRSLNNGGTNQLTALDPLADLSSLQTLNISFMKVSQLTPFIGLSALQTLYLQGTQVSNLAPLASLGSLQAIHVSQTPVSDLAPLTGLSSLQTLDVAHTKVIELAPLAGLSSLQTLYAYATQVRDLAPLAGLSDMRVLYVSASHVSDLTPLAGLPNLQRVSIAETQVESLRSLASLSALQVLFVYKTNISDLTPLAGLLNLQQLGVGDTQISDLTPLAGLSNLQRLDIANTQVSDLSPVLGLLHQGSVVKWSSDSLQGDGIYVEGCPFTNPPPEIVKQGNDAILNYFRERALGEVDHLYEAKMLILGEGGAGKTSLLRRLYQAGKPLPKEDETTKGISIYRHEFTLKNNRRFRLNVWDFGGQQIYHATHQFFLTHRSLYVLVDDTRKDYKAASDEGFKYWLELIDVFSEHSPTLIFQNEKGGRSKQIDLAGIRQRFDNVKEVYAGNLDNPDAVKGVRDGIEYFASHLGHIGEEVPARWVKVREEIETLAASEPYVPLEDYFEIYRKQIEFDESKALHLSRYLHDLGVFLHFQDDPLLARTVILQNEWATQAVFRILDDETVKKELGRFNRLDCARVWKDSAYANMHPELLALMQKFELCYELRDTQPQTWLAPQLLPAERPASLGEWGKLDDLVLRYRYEFLPKGIISRLTVRLHRFVLNPEKAWISGVLFGREGSSVLAEILANGEIELRARGPERKELLSIIAADLDALNESFHGLRDKVDRRMPCNCKVCRAVALPEFFDHRALLRRKNDNRLKVECPRSYEEVGVLELLDGIKMDKVPSWAKEEPIAKSAREIRIFLASSSELAKERDAFVLYLLEQADQLRKAGFDPKVVRWENFFNAMSETRMQDEYNKAIRDCDVFVSLFCTKVGKFTEEEFDVAYDHFKNNRKPRIYTFFKKALVDIDSLPPKDFESLQAFKAKLKELGHYPTKYENLEDLKLQFRGQIEKVLEKLQG